MKERGRKITLQKRDQKARDKKKKLKNYKPGAVSSIRIGLATKQKPMDVMKGEYYRRKLDRESKDSRNKDK